MSKHPLVMFSPLPPSRNGIADYTASFIEPLAANYDLYVVVPDDALIVHGSGFSTLCASEYERHLQAFRKVGHAYQIGNNLDHVYALKALSKRPGLVTIHDLSVQHMISASFVGGPAGQPYFELMFEAYGKAGLEIARDVPRWHRQSSAVHGELGLLPVLTRRSLGVVTHSVTGLSRLESCSYQCPVYLIPHPYQDRIDKMPGSREQRRAAARKRLGLEEGATIILSLGFVTRPKRIDLTLQALSVLKKADADFLFVVAGEANPQEIDLNAEVERQGLNGQVLIRGYVSDDDMLEYLAACDILVNLRYPTLGESSGSLANGLGMGCCTVVTDIGTFAEIPDACVIKVALREMTADGLAARLLPAIASPAYRRRLESNARRYAERKLGIDDFVERYIDALEQSVFAKTMVTPPPLSRRIATLALNQRRRVEELVREIEEGGLVPCATMWWRELLLPVADGSTILIEGGDFAKKLAHFGFGWNSTQGESGGPDAASTALIIKNAAEFLQNPVEMLLGFASKLMPGGVLVLNLVDTDEHAYAEAAALFDGKDASQPINAPKRSRMAALCERAGFDLMRQLTAFSEITERVPKNAEPIEFAIVAKLVNVPPLDAGVSLKDVAQ